jgi:hypothetical protein
VAFVLDEIPFSLLTAGFDDDLADPLRPKMFV